MSSIFGGSSPSSSPVEQVKDQIKQEAAMQNARQLVEVGTIIS